MLPALACLLGLASLATGQYIPPAHHEPHKEHKQWTLTCGEGGEKDPKKPNWTPPTWVYLNCGQFNIGEVVFASWGTPEGSCTGALGTSDSFKKGGCDDKDSVKKVSTLCVGKPKCKIPAGPAGATDGSGGNDFFGLPDPCNGTPKRLAVVISCDTGAWGGTFMLIIFLCGLAYVVGGAAYSIRVQQKSWAADGYKVLPHYDMWVAAGGLVSDGVEFSIVRYYKARGIPYNPAPPPIRGGAPGSTASGGGGGAQAVGYGSSGTWAPTGGAADDDDALWSDDESDGEGADFRTAAAILESALPDLGDDEEWATDSEEEFE